MLHDIWRGHLQFDRFEAFDVLSDGGGHRCVDLVFLRRLAGQLQAANKVRIPQDELFFVVIWHDVELCLLLEDWRGSSRALVRLILFDRLWLFEDPCLAQLVDVVATGVQAFTASVR